MPESNDEPNGPRTLPRAELNPLLNPLLAENMGRWAEVYFTSPPEKRDQAVLDLLRELEVESTAADTSDRLAPTSRPTAIPKHHQDDVAPEPEPLEELPPNDSHPQPTLMQCKTCGRENLASHKFCGMCGAKLSGSEDVESQPAYGSKHDDEAAMPEGNQTLPSYMPSPRNTNSLSLFQSVDEGSYGESYDWEYEPAPSRSYRFYIGAALAIVILALGYLAWRTSQATTQNSEGPPPAPPVSEKQSAAPPSTPASAAASKHLEQTPRGEPSAPAPSKSSAAPANDDRETAMAKPPESRASRPEPRQRTVQPASEKAEANSTTTPSVSNGNEELAVAEHYLNSANGQRRDSAEAAKWLWKSIAKHNDVATVLLADLYMKGDGVSKNCDQARVLLDSAARKGVSGAGERLRNLQAFGCQ